MTPIVTTTEVNRSAEDVFAYATDPTHFHEWQAGVTSGHMDGGERPRVGAHCVTTRRIGGSERSSTSELVHTDPPRSWGVRGIDGPIRATVEVAVEAVGNSRARLTISVDFDGHGIGRLLVPLIVAREARKEMPCNLEALKQRLEQT